MTHMSEALQIPEIPAPPGAENRLGFCDSPWLKSVKQALSAISCGSPSAGLPYNSIEVLILGNITNNGTTPINLNGGWIIIPFSMGVQTEYEGIWKRISDPNRYFKIFCWCAPCLHSKRAIAWTLWHTFSGCLIRVSTAMPLYICSLEWLRPDCVYIPQGPQAFRRVLQWGFQCSCCTGYPLTEPGVC